MPPLGGPALFMHDGMQTVFGGELGQFAFVEKEASAGARMPLEVADRRLNKNDDAIRGELSGELRKQRAV